MNTFIIIKPDAIFRGLTGEILSRFEQAGMRIIKIEQRHKDEKWFDWQYYHLIGKLSSNYLNEMADFVVDHPLIGVILDGDIDKVRLMVGATNCLEATPGTIRGDFGYENNYCNLIHASDSKESVEKETNLFFRSDNDCVQN